MEPLIDGQAELFYELRREIRQGAHLCIQLYEQTKREMESLKDVLVYYL